MAAQFDYSPVKYVNLRPDLAADLPALQNVTGATLMAWIYPEESIGSEKDIVALSKGSAAPTLSARATLRIMGTDELSVGGRAADSDGFQAIQSSTSPIQTSQWQHVAGVLDYANYDLLAYYNGVLVASNYSVGWSQGYTSDTPSRNGCIAAVADGSGSANFPGYIADLRVYSRALSIAEILSIVAARGCDGSVYKLEHRFLLNEQPENYVIGGTSNTVKDCGSRQLKQQVASGSPLWKNDTLRIGRRVT